jgi:hypothetical protein
MLDSQDVDWLSGQHNGAALHLEYLGLCMHCAVGMMVACILKVLTFLRRCQRDTPVKMAAQNQKIQLLEKPSATSACTINSTEGPFLPTTPGCVYCPVLNTCPASRPTNRQPEENQSTGSQAE